MDKIKWNSETKSFAKIQLVDKRIYAVDWDGPQSAIYVRTKNEDKIGYLFISLANDREDDERIIRVPSSHLSNFVAN